MKFRKKPVVIEAWEWRGQHSDKWPKWLLDYRESRTGRVVRRQQDGTLTIPTLEGDMTAQTGDWIIKGIQGELYPCKPDIFAATYDHAGETESGPGCGENVASKALDSAKVFRWDFRFLPDFHLMTPSAIEQVLQDGLLEVRSNILTEREKLRQAGVRVAE